MDRDEIIRMAKQAKLPYEYDTGRVLYLKELERFAELVAAAERQKSLQLWLLLDDVDTADDIAKDDDAVYRALCRQAHEKRWSVLNMDEVETAILARGEP